MNAISLLSDAQYFDENSTRFAEMRKLLDSREVRDKLEAMKRLLAVYLSLTLRTTRIPPYGF
jgi:hypothetical protein